MTGLRRQPPVQQPRARRRQEIGYVDDVVDTLEEAMHYQYEEKQTPTIDGSKALPMDQLNAELFYPQRKENVETNKIVQLMACEVAECILKELHDPGKATSDFLSSVKGKFSWSQQQMMNMPLALEKWQQMTLQKVHFLPSHISCNLLDESLVFMPQQ